MDKKLSLFISHLTSNKDGCDLEYLAAPQEWLEPMLGKQAKNYFRIYFRNRAADLCGEWDRDGKFDDGKQLPFVWLSSEGSPRTVIAKDTREFLSLLPYGQNVFTGIPELLKAYKRRPGKVISPEEKFNPAAIEQSYTYQASNYSGHKSLVGFITGTLNIAVNTDPLKAIRTTVESFPDLDEWIEKTL